MWGGMSCMKIIETIQFLCCSWGITKFSSISVYLSELTDHVVSPFLPTSSQKYGPIIIEAVNPHQTVTFGECKGIYWPTCGLASSQIRQLCVLTSPCKWKWASSLHNILQGYSSSTSSRAKNLKANSNRVFLFSGSNCWIGVILYDKIWETYLKFSEPREWDICLDIERALLVPCLLTVI